MQGQNPRLPSTNRRKAGPGPDRPVPHTCENQNA